MTQVDLTVGETMLTASVCLGWVWDTTPDTNACVRRLPLDANLENSSNAKCILAVLRSRL